MINRIASTFNRNFFFLTGSWGFKMAGTDILKTSIIVDQIGLGVNSVKKNNYKFL